MVPIQTQQWVLVTPSSQPISQQVQPNQIHVMPTEYRREVVQGIGQQIIRQVLPSTPSHHILPYPSPSPVRTGIRDRIFSSSPRTIAKPGRNFTPGKALQNIDWKRMHPQWKGFQGTVRKGIGGALRT